MGVKGVSCMIYPRTWWEVGLLKVGVEMASLVFDGLVHNHRSF